MTLGGCLRFELSGNSGWLLLLLILFSIVGFNSFDLYNHGRIAPGEGLTFGRYRPRDIAGRQSQRHGNGGGNGQDEVLDGLRKALFLCFG